MWIWKLSIFLAGAVVTIIPVKINLIVLPTIVWLSTIGISALMESTGPYAVTWELCHELYHQPSPSSCNSHDRFCYLNIHFTCNTLHIDVQKMEFFWAHAVVGMGHFLGLRSGSLFVANAWSSDDLSCEQNSLFSLGSTQPHWHLSVQLCTSHIMWFQASYSWG